MKAQNGFWEEVTPVWTLKNTKELAKCLRQKVQPAEVCRSEEGDTSRGCCLAHRVAEETRQEVGKPFSPQSGKGRRGTSGLKAVQGLLRVIIYCLLLVLFFLIFPLVIPYYLRGKKRHTSYTKNIGFLPKAVLTLLMSLKPLCLSNSELNGLILLLTFVFFVKPPSIHFTPTEVSGYSSLLPPDWRAEGLTSYQAIWIVPRHSMCSYLLGLTAGLHSVCAFIGT